MLLYTINELNNEEIKMKFITIIVLMFTSSFLLNGCSVVNSLKMMRANNDIKPIWPNGKPEQHLEAIYIGEKPYIRVIANDNEELLFLIDTGASFSALFDTEKAKPLAKERGYDLEIGGWGDEEDTKAYQSSLNSLNIGDVIFKNVKVAYIPLSSTPYYLRPDEAIFDGVLGHDILRHFSWTFDKANTKISVTATPYQITADDTSLSFDVSLLNKLSIPAKVRFNHSTEVERDIVIDTGSRHYMKLSAAYPGNQSITIPTTQINAADFGLSGMTKHSRVTLPALTLGNIKLNNVKTNLIPSDDEDDWWVIGSALMNQFVTVIDYHSNTFVISTYDNVKFHSLYNLAGLDLRKLQNGDLMVKYVFPELPADKAGFKSGDVITFINQKSTATISEDDWIALNAEPNEFDIYIKNKHCIKINTTHIAGYSNN